VNGREPIVRQDAGESRNQSGDGTMANDQSGKTKSQGRTEQALAA
jgi:hypothetical protein